MTGHAGLHSKLFLAKNAGIWYLTGVNSRMSNEIRSRSEGFDAIVKLADMLLAHSMHNSSVNGCVFCLETQKAQFTVVWLLI